MIVAMDAIQKSLSLCRAIGNACRFSSSHKKWSILTASSLRPSLKVFSSQIGCLINQAFVFSSQQASIPWYSSGNSSVLVIEPQPALQYTYRELLRQQGYSSVVVNTLTEALAIIDQDFDWVYLDAKSMTVQTFLAKYQPLLDRSSFFDINAKMLKKV